MKGFYPNTPKTWNRISWVMRKGGYKHALRFYWEIATICKCDNSIPGINQHCRDLSKSNVERCFKKTFGYGSFVDPSSTGKAVIKSETNAAHDGVVVNLPFKLKEGQVCQKYLPSAVEHRVLIIWGEPVCVLVKHLERQFADKCRMKYAELGEIFNSETRRQITTFAECLGMDYGELDLIKHDGKWYIIDANQCPGYNASLFDMPEADQMKFVNSHKPLFE